MSSRQYILFVILSINILFSQQWSSPINLGIAGIDDKYPQTCRVQQMWSNVLCLVWQVDQNNNWEIYSRFNHGFAWGDTVRITNNPAADYRPSVVYDYHRNCFWCVWVRDGDIYVAYSISNTWSTPLRLTSDGALHNFPSICFNHGDVWVAWERWEADSINIYSCYYSGTSWSSLIPITNDAGIHNTTPRINMRYNHPFVVWNREGDIYFSEYINDVWETPQPVTTGPANDSVPDLACWDSYVGVSVCWQSDQDGNYEIYRTPFDTFNVHYRVTVHDSADITPSPLLFQIPIRQYAPTIAFSTNRNGNYDIYTWNEWQGFLAVDTNHAQDQYPVMTADLQVYVWVLWQTDRNTDWDICGSYMYIPGGTEESKTCNQNYEFEIYPNPFSKSTVISYSSLVINDQLLLGSRGVMTNDLQCSALRIYDATGSIVKSFSLPNAYSLLPTVIFWDGTDDSGNRVPAGIYFVRLQTLEKNITRKIVKIK